MKARRPLPAPKIAASVVCSLVATWLSWPVANAAVADLITEPVDAAHVAALPQNRVAWATAESDLGEVADDLPLAHLTIVLKRSAEQQRAFEDFLNQQQDPASPNFHHWLTPLEVGEKFGASAHDIATVTSWLQSQGLQVNAVANSRTRIDFSGPAANVGAAFATRLHAYLVAGEQRIAPAGVPQVPAALLPIVQTVRGLSTSNERTSHSAQTTRQFGPPGLTEYPSANLCADSACDRLNHVISPDDFAVIYDLNPVYQQGINGAGQTIAIIGRARVYLPDIENFQKLSGLAVKDPLITLAPGGVDPGPAVSSGSLPSDQIEATLDVTRAGSVAPGATIALVISANTATSGGEGIASQYLVDSNPLSAQIMSISFDGCEADEGRSSVLFWDSLFSQAITEGISVFVSSGDSGAAGCDTPFTTPPASQFAGVGDICASSFATCVGGTEFADTANPSAYWSPNNGPGLESALGYIPEGAWNEPLDSKGNPQPAASGGGVSMYIATPPWQTGPGVPGAQGRYTPDVALSASTHNSYLICFAATGASCVADSSGRFSAAGESGTSASTPSVAGIAALLNQKMGSAQGNLNPRLYALAATPGNGVFHDVTVASSGVSGCSVLVPSMCNNSTPGRMGLSGGLAGYSVGPGYDEATGLGSIDVAKLLAQWSSVPPANANYQGLWWKAPANSEAGWGINFAHQGDIIFASWFTYDLNGAGDWLVMTAPKTAPNTYSGTLYATSGPPFNSVPFNPSQVVPTAVGTGTLTFTDLNDATFAYTVGSISQAKAITREVFGPLPTCATATGSLAAATNYTDLWWAAPAGSESGWGINLTQEGNIIFATWFTYDTTGQAMWLVVTASQVGPNGYSGTLYRTTGPPFNSVPFNPAQVVATAVGSATFSFFDGNDASFSYSVNGIAQAKPITREIFSGPGTVCQ